MVAIDRRVIVLSLSVIFIVWFSFFLIRLTAPSDLVGYDQERPAAYILDAAINGHWVIQRDDRGDICSKPPLYTWLGALLTIAFGRINHFVIFFPSALGVLGCCMLIWYFGRRYFGIFTAFVSALMYIASPLGVKMICLARTDSLFAFTVLLSAFLCFSAWVRGKGWTWFCLAAAAATLTKGPLGVVLAASGLLSYLWEKHETSPVCFRGNPWPGLVAFLAITLGWFAVAYWQIGQPVVDKMIKSELIWHTNWAVHGKIPGQTFYKPFLYFLSGFFPWSLLSCMGFWYVWKYPADNQEERMFERFLLCHFLFGLVIFSFAPHQRKDLLLPLFPSAALLAGRGLTFRFKIALTRHAFWLIVAAWVTILAIFGVYYHIVRNKQDDVIQTLNVQEAAQEFKAGFWRDFPLVYTDVPFCLQFYLNTMRPRISLQEAADRLASKEFVLVAVRDIVQLKNKLPPQTEINEFIRYPRTGRALVTIVGNFKNYVPPREVIKNPNL